MGKDLLTRADKIKFLADLSAGKTNISVLRVPKFEFWTLRNGLYKNEITKEVLHKREYQLHEIKTKKKKVHIFFTKLADDL